jgi:hypothetical protein
MVLLSISSFLGQNGAAWAATWLPLTVLAVVTAVIFHTILLMFGRAFSIKELETYATSEMLQAGATALMAGALIIMVSGAMVLATDYIHGTLKCGDKQMKIGTGTNIATGKNIMDDAYRAIRCTLQVRAMEVDSIQDSILSSTETWAEFNYLNMGASIFGITFFRGDWDGSVYRSTETKRITNNLATVMIIGLNAQSALLEYMRMTMLDIFLPVGILLRSFYFTDRKSVV